MRYEYSHVLAQTDVEFVEFVELVLMKKRVIGVDLCNVFMVFMPSKNIFELYVSLS